MKRTLLYLSGVFILVLFFFAQVLTAQYRIDTWTTENGLPQNSVNRLVQTRDGYIWLATNDGLVRFDGVRFKVFNKANSEELDTNRLAEVYEDGSGRLWVSGEDGSLLFYENGKFTLIAKASDPQFNPRTALVGDGEGGVIFCIDPERGHYQYKDGKFVPWEIAGLPKGAVINYRDREGGFWFTEGYNFHHLKDGVLQTFNIPKGGRYRNVYQDRFGNFWLVVDLASKEIYRIKNNQTQKIETPSYRYWGVAEDKTGNLWLNTFEQGVLRLDAKDVNSDELKPENFQRFKVQDGLLSDACRVLITDREGGIWVGSEKGLHLMLPQTVHVFSKKDGLQEDNIYPILEDRSGTIWLGAWQQSLIKYREGVFSTFLNSDQIPYYSSLFEDRDGKLWLGNDGNVFYLENGKPVRFTDQAGFGGGAVFNAISQDSDGNMWFGSSKGLSRYSNGQATVFTTKDGLPDNVVVAFLQARNGKIWIGTRGGIAVLSVPSAVADGSVSTTRLLPQTVLTEHDGLASNYTRSLYEDSDGVLWIGSYDGGLTRYKDGKLTRYGMKEGLFSDGVFCILEDNRGWFWMNSNQGIYRVRKQELNDFAEGKTKFLTSIAYGKQDGLLNVEGNGGRQPAGIKAHDGKLWFPMAQGVAVVDPETVTTNPLPPPVLIEETSIDRRPIDNETFQSAIRNPQSAITLNSSQNNLEIQYTGLSFISSGQVKFKYKLEGLETDWNEVGTRRAAYYSYLPAGEYTFHVIAANRDGVWNMEGASIKVKVLPPFYRTWWFIALAVFCVLGLGFLIFKARINQIEKERKAQEEFSRRLLASQEQERQRIAAELHDSLGQSLLIIKNRIVLAQSDIDEKEVVEEQLDELSHSASSAIEECREIAYNLRPYQINRFGLSKTLYGIFMRISEVTNINASTEIDTIDDLLTDEAQINVYRIVQECVNNIIKHSDATEAMLVIKRNENDVTLLIQDNGRGFVQSKFATSENKRSGFGLIGIAERVKMLGGSCEIDSTQGTSIKIKI